MKQFMYSQPAGRGSTTRSPAMSDDGRRDAYQGDLPHSDLSSGGQSSPSTNGRPIRSIPLEELTESVYQELRAVAVGMLRGWRPGNTLGATGLVHEAWLKLFGSGTFDPQDQTHLFAATVQAMSRVLIEYERKRNAKKRLGGRIRHPLEVMLDNLEERHHIAFGPLQESLEELGRRSPRQHLIMTHVLLGHSQKEIAELLNLSSSSVERDIRMARAWLYRQLKD